MASRPRVAISLRTTAQRRSRSARERRGTSSVLRMLNLCVASRRRRQLLEAGEIVGDSFFEIVLRAVAELLARAADVIDPGRGVWEAVEVQPAADLHARIRDVLSDDALEVAQRHAYTGADVVDAALDLVRHGRDIDAEGGILVVDEVVLVVAALRERKRHAGRRIFDNAAHHRHRPVPGGLARPVGRGEAQRYGLDAQVVV